MIESAQTRYARCQDGTSIAYRAVGDGPVDLLTTTGLLGNVEFLWEIPAVADFRDRLAAIARLLLYDRRGTSLSDRPSESTTMETGLDDMLAVLDAVESEHAALMGRMDSGASAALLAAQHPGRISAFVWYLPTPRCAVAADYPWGATEEDFLRQLTATEDSWGSDAAVTSEVLVSSTVKDLVAGSGLVFVDRGEHQLKGVPEPWHLYAVAASGMP